MTREDIDAVSVCSITFTRSFVRSFAVSVAFPTPLRTPPLFHISFNYFLIRFDDLFYPKGNFWFGFRERFFGSFSGKIFRSPWTIVVCYGYHTFSLNF